MTGIATRLALADLEMDGYDVQALIDMLNDDRTDLWALPPDMVRALLYLARAQRDDADPGEREAFHGQTHDLEEVLATWTPAAEGGRAD